LTYVRHLLLSDRNYQVDDEHNVCGDRTADLYILPAPALVLLSVQPRRPQ